MNSLTKYLSTDRLHCIVRRAAMPLILAVLLVALCPCASAIPAKPVPERLVNDFAGIFTAEEALSLERALTAFDDSTSNQITVVTVNDLEGYAPAEYGTEIGERWGVGSGKFDNGIVVLVKPKTGDSRGQVNISVGYGLEGAIPDSYCKRIIETEMIPRFRENDYFGGTAAACSVLMKLASGEISEPREADSGGGPVILFLALAFIGFCIFIVIVASGGKGGNGGSGGGGYMDGDDFARGLIIGSILNGGRHSSGWGSSGGGFGGGFGGGSFGGFGGGSFGGGGASGSW